MVTRLHAGEIFGIDAVPVEVEVDIAPGLPRFNLVGLPDAALSEAKERVRAALRHAGFKFPMKRIVVNLAPADLRKVGPAYDLAVALGILIDSGQVEPARPPGEFLFLGELSLAADLRPVAGVLPQAVAARALGKTLVVPSACFGEASLVKGGRVLAFATLAEVIAFLQGGPEPPPPPSPPSAARAPGNSADFAEVLGQPFARRGLEIAAAGFHNVLMVGPPGSGKTLMARTFPTILPELTEEESLEVSKIYSIAGLLERGELIRGRVFRSPHSSLSDIAMVGGTSSLRPGEVTLAHRGVLFLDEMAEFRKSVLEMLRTPLSDGRITISRSCGSVTYPARFLFVGATNPCPCGHLGDASRECVCNEHQIRAYRSKLSGPILDRIDLHVEVGRVDLRTLRDAPPAESSETVRARVKAALPAQEARFGAGSGRFNSAMEIAEVNRHCRLPREVRALLDRTAERSGFSLRAYHKVLKVARTIADLAGREKILQDDVLEAVSYRFLDRASPF